jgi:hypothetical protein
MDTIKIIKTKGPHTFACNFSSGTPPTPVNITTWTITLRLHKGSIEGDQVWEDLNPTKVIATFTSVIPELTVGTLEAGPYVLDVQMRNADSTIKLDKAIPVKVLTRSST